MPDTAEEKSLLLPGLVIWTLIDYSFAADFETERLKNWHQWRGPYANGIAPTADPPVRWSKTENVRWKVAVPGVGSATPIVWNDRVFVVTAVKTGREAENAPAESEPEPPREERRDRRRSQSAEPFANRVPTEWQRPVEKGLLWIFSILFIVHTVGSPKECQPHPNAGMR